MEKNNQNDYEDWQRVKENDPTAFTLFFERYWEEMFSIAWRRIGDEAPAKDIVQDIFVHCWENRHHIEVEESLAPYLFTALKYSVVRYIYRASRRTILPLSIMDLPEGEMSYQEDWISYEKLQQDIEEEIGGMPARMQEIFQLSRDKQLSIKEIARRLSLSEQTVKNQLSTALKRLRLRLQDHAFFLPFLL